MNSLLLGGASAVCLFQNPGPLPLHPAGWTLQPEWGSLASRAAGEGQCSGEAMLCAGPARRAICLARYASRSPVAGLH